MIVTERLHILCGQLPISQVILACRAPFRA
jgi:hypothetical protein